MKKSIWLDIYLLLIPFFIFAQPISIKPTLFPDSTFQSLSAEQENSETAKDEKNLTHAQVVVPPLISAILVGLYIVESGLFEELDLGEAESLIREGTLYSAHVPVYFIDPLRGLVCTGFTLGLRLSTDFLLSQDEYFFAGYTYTGIMQTAFFSTYIAYREGRIRAEEGIYSDTWREESLGMFLKKMMEEEPEVYQWRPYSFLELCLTPFEGENIFDPMVFLLPVAALGQLIVYSHEDAIWTTGRAYIGTHEITPALAIPLMGLFLLVESIIIGVTEESHFRGFIYEEMGSNFGPIPAKIFDAIYFPAIHIPTDLYVADYEGLDILKNFLSRSVLTVYLDTLYDKGGLPRSVAAHVWLDFSLFFINYLLRGGVPQTDLGSLLEIFPGITVSYRIWF